MKIAFYLEDEGFRWMAEAFVASALRFAPAGVRIMQLSPTGVEQVSGTHEVFRFDANPNMTFLGRYFASELCYHQPPIAEDSAVRDEVMFCNVDMLFIKPFHWPQFTGSVALPHIADPIWKWDGAMCILADSTFLPALVRHPACWYGDRPIPQQLDAIDQAVKACQQIHWLPGRVWSYVPRHALDAPNDTVLVHYRGERKEWMARALGIKDPQDWRTTRGITHSGLKEKRR